MQTSFTIPQNFTFFEYFHSTGLCFNNIRFRLWLLFFIFFPNIIDFYLWITIKGFQVHWLQVFVTSFVLLLMVFLGVVGLLIICLFFYYGRPGYFTHVSYFVNHWGVTKNTGSIATATPWRKLVKYKETRSFFLLYTSRRSFYALQKRNFKDSAEMEDFRMLLEENLST